MSGLSVHSIIRACSDRCSRYALPVQWPSAHMTAEPLKYGQSSQRWSLNTEHRLDLKTSYAISMGNISVIFKCSHVKIIFCLCWVSPVSFYLKIIILVACSILLLDSAVLNYKLIKDRGSFFFYFLRINIFSSFEINTNQFERWGSLWKEGQWGQAPVFFSTK